MNRITDNRKIWETIKPNFPGRTLKDERITLVYGDKVITEEIYVVKKFKDHFEKILETLKIYRPILSDLNDDPVHLERSHHLDHIVWDGLLKIFPTMLVFLKSKKRKALLIAFPLN